ncbi:MAG: phosphoesterase [Frankiales bacterium]|jgi:membrane-associated phospholipid phosphatase|nr:phosphoesterase [Frankiales bacterium]
MTERRVAPGLAESLGSALADLRRLDQATYTAIAATPTPTLDVALRRVSNAANYSRIWMAIAAGLTVAGGRPGRRAAVQGMAAIGISSAAVNLLAKQLVARQRPDRAAAAVLRERQVRMPASTSFPSGHAASAVAFATAAGDPLPFLSLPLHLLAATVGYSRVHTGVHYPADVIVGAVIGSAVGNVVRRLPRGRG